MNIEEIGTPYPVDRRGVRATTGPSASTAPGEREMFDHSNLWIPGPAFQNIVGTKPTVTSGDSTSANAPVRIFTPRSAGAASSTVKYSFRRPRLWIGGSAFVRCWFTGVADASTQIQMEIGVEIHTEGSSTKDTTTYEVIMDPPTSSGVMMIDREHELTSASREVIDFDHDLIIIEIRRTCDATDDTYDENLELIGVEICYKDTAGSQEGLPAWLMKL